MFPVIRRFQIKVDFFFDKASASDRKMAKSENVVVEDKGMVGKRVRTSQNIYIEHIHPTSPTRAQVTMHPNGHRVFAALTQNGRCLFPWARVIAGAYLTPKGFTPHCHAPVNRELRPTNLHFSTATLPVSAHPPKYCL